MVGTAGHIDHGKSALVRALTGTDPDRLKEEKERGITIDLGFAHTDLGDGVVASFIDVPGHERFVRNMLAGAFGIDAVVLVVAADESVMPQTREHFHICRLLGIPRGLVVLSKCDLADAETQALAELEVRELVLGSFLEGRPILRVSARTGEGLPALREARCSPWRARRPRAGSHRAPAGAGGPGLHPARLRHRGHGHRPGRRRGARGRAARPARRPPGAGARACRSTARRWPGWRRGAGRP